MDKKFNNRPQRIEQPDVTNVAFMDEYPRLAEKVRLRNLGRAATGPTLLYHLPVRAAELDDLRSLMEEAPQGSRGLPDDSA